jgi:hypothetical protein
MDPATPCKLVLSFLDLSVWDYGESYGCAVHAAMAVLFTLLLLCSRSHGLKGVRSSYRFVRVTHHSFSVSFE